MAHFALMIKVQHILTSVKSNKKVQKTKWYNVATQWQLPDSFLGKALLLAWKKAWDFPGKSKINIIRPCYEQNTARAVTSTRERLCACDRTAKKISTNACSDQIKKLRKELQGVTTKTSSLKQGNYCSLNDKCKTNFSSPDQTLLLKVGSKWWLVIMLGCKVWR